MTGAIIVIVGIIFMVMIHEAGHFVAAKAFGMKATEFFFGFGPRIWSIRRGETEYGVKAIPLGGYVRIIGMNPFEEVEAGDEGRTYRRGKFWQKSVVVLAGVGSNFLVGFILLYIVAVGIGQPNPDQPLPVIGGIVPTVAGGEPSAAVRAGLQEGDRIVSFNGGAVSSWEEFVGLLHDAPNAAVVIEVSRGGEVVSVSPTLTSRYDPDERQMVGFLGVSPRYETERDGPLAGLASAGSRLWVLFKESVRGLWALVWGIGGLLAAVFQGEVIDTGARPLSPIGIARLGAASEQVGLDLTITLVAWFNIFIGMLNVLPVYPLDGGHFSVALYEKVTGREPDVRKLVPVAAAVVIVLVLLGALGIYLDIVDPINLG